MTTTNIVTVNASVVLAPTPNNLQQTGGLISQGGTTLTPGTATLVSTFAQLQALLATGKAITSLAWATSVVTVTTASPHGWTNGDVVPITIAGAVPAGYNGTFTGTITGASTLTYPLAANPGAETTPGTVALGAITELTLMGTTYFAGNGVPAIYVVELGEGTPTENVPDLTTFIGKVKGTTGQIYNYLVPRGWDNNATFLAFLANYTAVNAQTYFWVTTTVANAAVYAALKCVYAEVESPTVSATEFSLASAFGVATAQTPSSTNKLTPLSYSPSYGTTAYPVTGNQATLQTLANDNVGWIGTGQHAGHQPRYLPYKSFRPFHELRLLHFNAECPTRRIWDGVEDRNHTRAVRPSKTSLTRLSLDDSSADLLQSLIANLRGVHYVELHGQVGIGMGHAQARSVGNPAGPALTDVDRFRNPRYCL